MCSGSLQSPVILIYPDCCIFVLQVTEESLRSLMFGNFMDVDATDEEKKYEEIPSLEAFKNIAEEALEEYNATHKTKMDIVLFRYWAKWHSFM
jgi:hypothetical protein